MGGRDGVAVQGSCQAQTPSSPLSLSLSIRTSQDAMRTRQAGVPLSVDAIIAVKCHDASAWNPIDDEHTDRARLRLVLVTQQPRGEWGPAGQELIGLLARGRPGHHLNLR